MKRMNLRLTGMAAILLATSATAQMTTGVWVNTVGGNWSDAGSWDPLSPPSATAMITNNGAYTINLDQNVTIGTIRLWAASPTLVVQPGMWLNITNNGGTGSDPNNGMSFSSGGAGTRVVIDGGIVTNRGYYLTGSSSIIITNGGSMVVLAGTPRLIGTSFLTLNGGTLVHNSTMDFGYGTASDDVRIRMISGNASFGNTFNIAARGSATYSIEGATVTNARSISLTTTPPSGTTPQTGRVSIASGTLVHRDTLLIGNTSSDTANLAQFNLSGGSYLNTSNQLIRVGNASTGSLTVAGGTFTATNGAAFTLGNTGSARGVGYVTNSAGTMRVGAATVQKGQWTITGGSTFADSITATLPTGLLDFRGGNVSAGAMTIGNGAALTVGDGASSASLALRGNSTFSNGLTIASAAALIVSNTSIHTLIGDVSGNGGLLKTGSGWMTLRGANTYAGGTTNAAGILEAVSPGALPGYGTPGAVVVRNGGTVAALAAGEAGQWTAADIDTLVASATWDAGGILGIDVPSNSFTYGTALSGAKGFTKLGAGALTLNGANTYTGPTAVRGGTMLLGSAGQLSPSAALFLGDPLSTASAGTLDLGGYGQQVAQLFTATLTNNNATATNAILNVGAGQALNVVSSGAASFVHLQDGTHLEVSGAGSLNISNASSRVLIWGNRSADGATFRGLDLSGLGSFSASVNDIVIGYDVNTGTQASRQGVLALAGTNTITANTIFVGVSAMDGSVRGRLVLGVSNALNVGTLNIANDKGYGSVYFDPDQAGGSLYLAGTTPGSRANVSLGEFKSNASGTTPTGNLSLTNAGSAIFASLDQLLVGSLNISGANAAAGGRGSVEFNGGAVDVNTVILGRTQAGTTNGMAIGTLTMNGGAMTVNTAFTLAQQNGTRPATGSFTLNGGTATFATTLAAGGGTSSVTVAGGTLDMQGNAIGSGANPVGTLNLQSGTLRNLGQVNNGAALTKSGTGTLTVEGANAYTGALSVEGGTLRYNGFYSGGGLITVQAAARLAGTGTVAGVTVANGAYLSPGNSAGQLTVTDLTLGPDSILEYDLGTASDLILAGTAALGGIEFGDFVFTPGPGFGPGAYTLIDATTIGGLGANKTGTVGAYNAELSIDSGTQNLMLTVVPEPATLGLLGMAAALALRRRNRSRR